MRRRFLLPTLGIACSLCLVATVHAQTGLRQSSGQAARPATIAKPAAPAAASAAQRPPSVCPPGRLCDEVPSFAAAITDFKAASTPIDEGRQCDRPVRQQERTVR